MTTRWLVDPVTSTRCRPTPAAPVEEALGLARMTGDRVPVTEPVDRAGFVTAALRWMVATFRPGEVVPLATSGRLAALGRVDEVDRSRLVVTTWDQAGAEIRRLEFPSDALELALVELEAQGDHPAVLVHPSVLRLI